MKQSELLDEAVERRATLQNEIHELEARIAEEESRVLPVPPPGPPPAVPVAFPPPPEDENEEDAQTENDAPIDGAGVGEFVSPSQKKVIKSTFRKRASLRLTESRSLVFAKLSKLSSQELLKLSERCSALAKDRDPDLDRTSLRCLPRRRMMHKVRSWGIISRRKSSGNEEDIFLIVLCRSQQV